MKQRVISGAVLTAFLAAIVVFDRIFPLALNIAVGLVSLAAVEELENAILVSIHQNTYPGSQYHGTHVFYAPTEGSQPLAEHIQTSIKAALQPDNERAVKQIPDTVYIMNHVTCPAVLIECGFLTNPEEEALLRDEEYQRKLAAVIAGAWLTMPDQAG